MKKIAFIIPYFGEFPNYFEYFLLSCKYNPEIDFYIYTDNKKIYNFPSNVKIKHIKFEQLRNNIQSLYDFNISLDLPYKLCDYKSAYGDIFKDDLKAYDFWGHCDIDLIFGKISNFVKDEILNENDKIYFKGHFSLFRNCKKMNELYKKNIEGEEYYKKVFSNPQIFQFDEGGLGKGKGMYTIIKNENIKFYEKPDYTSLNFTKYYFIPSLYPYDESEEKKIKHSIYIWKDGRLYRYGLKGKEIYTNETMYLHLQKRKIKIIDKCNGKSFIICPNKIEENHFKVINKKLLKKKAKHFPIYMPFIKSKIIKIKNTIKGIF